ncbi:MAG: hypothetical protein Q8O46_04980 [bacterium]|nr:hypothetical protein [bacterium]
MSKTFLRVMQEPLAEGLDLPYYAYPGDAGLQLVTAEDAVIAPHSGAAIKTGLRVIIPEGCYLAILSRGASAKFGVGFDLEVVDAPYRGPLTLLAWNKGAEPVFVPRGSVAGQGVLLRFEEVEIEKISAEEYSAFAATERGEGRIGSSGRKPRLLTPDESATWKATGKLPTAEEK